MALWKDPAQKDPLVMETGRTEENLAPVVPFRRAMDRSENKQSIIASGVTIAGKIEGEGDVRIEGRFEGDVNVQGDLIIESGAHISGEIRAKTVTIGGEVEGNINAAAQVRLLESGQLIGDLKAPSLTVAAGSRMRGKVEFGWDERDIGKFETKKVDGKAGNGSML